MIKLFWAGVALLIVLSGCGSGNPSRSNDFTPLTSIRIVAVPSSIAAHTSIKLTAIGDFSGLFTRDITDQVVWTSNTPAVANFITTGSPQRITAVAPGVAAVTATKVGLTGNFNLTVSAATINTLTITPAAPSVPLGLNSQFTVSGTFSDNTTQDLTFDAVWTSDNLNVATVSMDAGSKGLAHTVALGSANIKAAFDGLEKTAPLTVIAAQLQSITVTTANSTVLSLSPISFTATGHYSDSSSADITDQVVWGSSAAGVITFVNGANAKTLSQGTTQVTASLTGISGQAALKVTGGTLISIALNVPSTLVKGTQSRLTATGTFNNGTTRDITSAVAWSSNPAFATVVSAAGNLAWLNGIAETAVLTPTKISATAGTVTTEANLSVVAPALQSLSILSARTDLSQGTSARFILNGSFSNGTIQDVTFNSDWTSNGAAASVGNAGLGKGRVSGVSASGTPVTITASYGGMSATIGVAVTARTIQSLSITGPASITQGKQEKYTAKAAYNDGTIQDVTEDATWTIDKPNIAFLADNVSQPGQVVAVDSGIAALTAVFNGQTLTVNITVP